MLEMGLDVTEVRAWFVEQDEGTYSLIELNDAQVAVLADRLPIPLRRAYAADAFLTAHAATQGLSTQDVLNTLLPPPGATMAGDFGEILVYCYQGSLLAPENLVGYKKWRLKQDRSKPAPYSDVIHVYLPDWPNPSADDRLLCSEVKVKSTAGAFQPVPAAIRDSEKDRTSRLAKTLVWLRERAVTQPAGAIDIEKLNRLIDGIALGPVAKEFRAVAIVDSNFLAGELATIPVEPFTHCSLVVVSLPGLGALYSNAFAASAANAQL